MSEVNLTVPKTVGDASLNFLPRTIVELYTIRSLYVYGGMEFCCFTRLLKKADVKQYLANEVSEVSFDSSTLHIVNQVQLHHQNQEVK